MSKRITADVSWMTELTQ